MSCAVRRVALRSAALAAALGFLEIPASALESYSGVYIFGDSLVDSGNAQEAANFIDSLPFPFPSADDPAPASAGYFNGRLTNGYNVADLLSIELAGGLPKTSFPFGFPTPLGPFPIFEPGGNRINFAYGGAQAVGGKWYIPDLTDQVDAYSALSGGADAGALHIIVIGGNDLRRLVPQIGPTASATEAASLISFAANTILDQVDRLFDLGADNILLTAMPDIGLLPLYEGGEDEELKRSAGSQYAAEFDNLLLSGIGSLSLPPADELIFFSLRGFADEIFEDPAAFGFTNLTQPCLGVMAPSPSIDCSGFFFFDEIHPTTAVHQLAANAILNELKGPAVVPEPASWIMLLLGFAAIGVAMRRACGITRWAAAG